MYTGNEQFFKMELDDVIPPRRFTLAFPILHGLGFLIVKNLEKTRHLLHDA